MSASESVETAPDFETASDVLIKAIEKSASAWLAQNANTKDARIARASVHVIASDGWRQLAASEWSASPRDPKTQSEVRRSSTLWSLIKRFQCPVGVTVLTKAIQLYRVPEVERTTEEQLDDFNVAMTMVKGTATHALALPITSGREAIDGMVALEVVHRRGLVEELVWGELPVALSGEIGRCAELLLSKPQRRSKAATRESDDELPPNEASELARVFGPLKDHILIRGPSGVGKTYLAREIHAISGRTGKFIPYNALSFPNDLQVAYLLGWRAGAFTGANETTAGAIEEARGGTIFVDEVDKLSSRAQVALMSLTDKDGSYTPIGEVYPRPVGDVRFVFATNADLEQLVEAGDFRHDLHFRINVFPISIPSISERRHEIAAWCEALLREIHADANSLSPSKAAKRRCRISAGAVAIARGRHWPGNLRQLGTILKRAYALASLRSGDVVVDAPDMKRALAMDMRMSGAALLRQLESVAQKIAEITEYQLADWVAPEDPQARDRTNPGLAARIGRDDLLFALVWREMEKSFPDRSNEAISKMVGRETAYVGNNYSRRKGEAFRKAESFSKFVSIVR